MIIDIHNHLAWDVDDGIATKEDTITVLKQAQSQGIQAIVATPHFVPGSQSQQDIQIIQSRIEELKELARQYDIQILSGCELFMNHNFLDMIDEQLVNKIENTDYLLVEFDVRHTLGKEEDVEERLYELDIRHYKVVLAHVERYFPKGIDIERVRDLYNAGYIIQMNKTSLLGKQGKVIQKNAIQLLNERLVHVIASDTHRTKGRDILFDEAIRYVKNKYNDEYADLLFYKNPKHIINNEDVEELPYIKKGFFSKLKGR